MVLVNAVRVGLTRHISGWPSAHEPRAGGAVNDISVLGV